VSIALKFGSLKLLETSRPVQACNEISLSLTLRRLKVLEITVLRRKFWLKRNETTGEWIKLHNKELNDIYSSPSIVRVIKSTRMRWANM
jgi:hypothetical protein